MEWWICNCGKFFEGFSWDIHSKINPSHVIFQWKMLDLEKKLEATIKLFKSQIKEQTINDTVQKYAFYGIFTRKEAMLILSVLELLKKYSGVTYGN